jgi:GC-rich sequence DNA-binding factor
MDMLDNADPSQVILRAVFAVYHNTLLSLSASIIACTIPTSLPPPAFDPASRPAMERYLSKRMKLLRNILLWRREAPQEVRELVTRLVAEVFRPILSRTWGGGGREMGAKVCGILRCLVWLIDCVDAEFGGYCPAS